MLDINDLEKKWFKYKIKSFLPHAVIFFSLTLILIIVTIINSENTNPLPNATQNIIKNIHTDTPIKKTQNNQNKPTTNTINAKQIAQQPVVNHKQEKLTLSPSLNFINKMKSSTIEDYELNRNYITEKSVTYTPNKQPLSKNTKSPEKKAPIIKQKTIPNKEVIKENSINITRQTTNNDIKDVIKRFNISNNPALSLFIAKKYYEFGKYHDSYNYALMTNEINNNIEESWIIFTKSLVKLNEKEMAIKTLKKYIAHSKSNKAARLLDKIESGKFQ